MPAGWGWWSLLRPMECRAFSPYPSPLAAGVGTPVSPALLGLVVFGLFVYMFISFLMLCSCCQNSTFHMKKRKVWSLKLEAQLLIFGGAGLVVQALETTAQDTVRLEPNILLQFMALD